MMRLYVSSKMTGLPNYGFDGFFAEEKRLLIAGFEVENPAAKGIIDGWGWAEYLKYDVKALLECQGVATFGDWEDSRGALFEVFVAETLEIPVKSVDQWLKWAEGIEPVEVS